MQMRNEPFPWVCITSHHHYQKSIYTISARPRHVDIQGIPIAEPSRACSPTLGSPSSRQNADSPILADLWSSLGSGAHPALSRKTSLLCGSGLGNAAIYFDSPTRPAASSDACRNLIFPFYFSLSVSSPCTDDVCRVSVGFPDCGCRGDISPYCVLLSLI